jgi:AraC-like DNA-binding protein
MASRPLAPGAGLGGTARYALLAQDRRPADAPLLDRFGWMPGKTEAIDRRFRDLTLMLVLAGAGDCLWRGRRLRVEAPCLMVFRPGEHASYAPDAAWDEAYLVWRRPASPAELGLAARDGPQPLAAPRLCAAWFALLLHLGPAAAQPGVAAQCDLAALGVARAAIATDPVDAPVGPAARIAAAAAEAEAHLDREVDLADLARRHGFSASQLRRAWRSHLGDAPGAWIAARREARATSMLAGGDAPIAAVAAACGFADRRSFTRWLRSRSGLPPSRLREAGGTVKPA